jgi:hypothetical protein
MSNALSPEFSIAAVITAVIFLFMFVAISMRLLHETVIHRGKLRQELVCVAREKEVSLIVFGRPMDAKIAFLLPDLESFTAVIETETGIKTRIIDLVEPT